MRIAIPSEAPGGLGAMRSGHFGHCACFTIVEYDDEMNIVSATAVPNIDHDVYGCGGVISYVLDMGVDGILAAGMGRPPLMRFTESGVIVYAETMTPNVGDAAKLFAEGKVQRMSPEAACNHHSH
ncbi:MAG: NifB/NifX family molybdenum-iron cluster-binding protein [Eggerthellaceae bacterium]|nr:NifB/NifX family molybdenum-iron cluster-binding protein [Eggerthellaceae bacterium]